MSAIINLGNLIAQDNLTSLQKQRDQALQDLTIAQSELAKATCKPCIMNAQNQVTVIQQRIATIDAEIQKYQSPLSPLQTKSLGTTLSGFEVTPTISKEEANRRGLSLSDVNLTADASDDDSFIVSIVQAKAIGDQMATLNDEPSIVASQKQTQFTLDELQELMKEEEEVPTRPLVITGEAGLKSDDAPNPTELEPVDITPKTDANTNPDTKTPKKITKKQWLMIAGVGAVAIGIFIFMKLKK